MLTICRVIVSKPVMRVGDVKAALTIILTSILSDFNKHLGQLDAGFIDNVNIKEVDLGKKGLHLNKKKLRTDLN